MERRGGARRLWIRATVTVMSGWALLMLGQTAWAQPATTDTSRGFSIRYSDGRTTTRPLRPRGGMMTAVFPRISGIDTAREGMSLNGLDVSHVVDGAEVIVTVSLLYRSGPNKSALKVATVRLAAERPVVVNELTRYGVEPIALSIVSIPPSYAFPPQGISVSSYVDVHATPVGDNAAAYRVTITNRGPFPLMWFRFEAYRAEGSPISGRPRGKRDFPLIVPNGEYTFELPVGTVRSAGEDPAEWQPLDRIEVTSLMWQDGIVEGDKDTARQQDAFDRRRSEHIRALLTILRGNRRSVVALRDDMSRTRPPDVEMTQVRDGLIEQLDRFADQRLSSDSREFAAWLDRTVIEQKQWLARIVFPKL